MMGIALDGGMDIGDFFFCIRACGIKICSLLIVGGSTSPGFSVMIAFSGDMSTTAGAWGFIVDTGSFGAVLCDVATLRTCWSSTLRTSWVGLEAGDA